MRHRHSVQLNGESFASFGDYYSPLKFSFHTKHCIKTQTKKSVIVAMARHLDP